MAFLFHEGRGGENPTAFFAKGGHDGPNKTDRSEEIHDQGASGRISILRALNKNKK
jgi:hypothetical protein